MLRIFSPGYCLRLSLTSTLTKFGIFTRKYQSTVGRLAQLINLGRNASYLQQGQTMKNSRIVQQFKQLEPQLAGKLCFAPDLQYHERRQVFNRAVDAWPVAILEVQHIQDVCLAIRFAREQHIQISVKGGGHSTSGSCMLDDALVLDMSALKQIQFDPIKRRVIVAAGVRNFELDKASSEHLQAVPLGTCPDVGVVGAAMGGGIGYLSCAYGLSCDSIESITLVNADAQILTVNSTQHSDLFWALRGGGGCQFGVVIDMTFRQVRHIASSCLLTLPIGDRGQKSTWRLRVMWPYKQMLMKKGSAPIGKTASSIAAFRRPVLMISYSVLKIVRRMAAL